MSPEDTSSNVYFYWERVPFVSGILYIMTPSFSFFFLLYFSYYYVEQMSANRFSYSWRHYLSLELYLFWSSTWSRPDDRLWYRRCVYAIQTYFYRGTSTPSSIHTIPHIWLKLITKKTDDFLQTAVQYKFSFFLLQLKCCHHTAVT